MQPSRAENIIGNFKHVESWREVGEADNPGFASSWINYGSGFNSAAFYRDPFGVVHLKGLVKNGTVGSAQTIFTLPANYIPTDRYMFDAVSYDGAAYVQGRVDILNDGRVVPITGHTTYISLDGISFRAA